MNRSRPQNRSWPPWAILLALTAIVPRSLPAQYAVSWEAGPPLPEPISNNAVAGLSIGDTTFVYSFMGIDTTKAWSGITREARRLNTVTGEWSAIAPVPGAGGRIAAAAVPFGGRIYVFGGYSVAQGGSETTWDAVDIYDPASDAWSAGAPIPVPVDDQMAAAWRDTLIYLVSGWSRNHNVKNVQVYDPAADTWAQATPIPGAGVFGHAGAIAGDTIVYADGVRVQFFSFLMNAASYAGRIDPTDPLTIEWAELPTHPGPAKYRMAAGVLGGRILFAGGTDNPYNFDGIGYDNVPSEPDGGAFTFDPATKTWQTLDPMPVPTMDHRGLVGDGERLFAPGGMAAGRVVTNSVAEVSLDSVTAGIGEGGPGGAPRPRAFRLRQNRPNPFNPSTTIAFEIAGGRAGRGPHDTGEGPDSAPGAVAPPEKNASSGSIARITLDVFDLRGRRVRRLIDAPLGPGTHRAVWDGRDGRGRALPSGAYLYRLRAGASVSTRKMILRK